MMTMQAVYTVVSVCLLSGNTGLVVWSGFAGLLLVQ